MSKKKISTVYKKIKRDVDKLNKERIEIRGKVVVATMIAFLVAIGVMSFFKLGWSEQAMKIRILILAGCMIPTVLYLGKYCIKDFYERAFQKVIRPILEIYLPNCQLSLKDSLLSKTELQNSGMFQGVHHYKTNKLLTYSVKGSKKLAKMAHITAFKKEKRPYIGARRGAFKPSNKRNTYREIFSGVLYNIPIKNSKELDLLLIPDTAEKLLGKSIGQFIQKNINKKGSFKNELELVKLENIIFEKEFVIYSNDQIKVRQFFNPKRMEKMAKLQEKIGRKFYFRISHGQLLIAVKTKDFISAPLFEEILGRPTLSEMYKVLSLAKVVQDMVIEEFESDIKVEEVA